MAERAADPPAGLAGFEKTHIYEATAPVDSLLADLDEIRRRDLEHEKLHAALRKKALVRGLGAFFGAFAVCFICTPIGSVLASLLGELADLDEEAAGFFGACCGTVPGGIFLAWLAWTAWQAGREASKYARLDWENRRYDLLARVLTTLDPDIAPEATVAVSLDLRPPTHPSKHLQDRDGVTDTGWNVKHYRDPWLRAAGKLADGTAFKLSLIEKHQARDRWKRNARGKNKYKTKSKAAGEAVLALRPKADRYRQLETLMAEASAAVRLPAGVEQKALGFEGGVATLRATLGAWTATPPGQKIGQADGAHAIAMMFLSLYQVLNLAKRMEPPA